MNKIPKIIHYIWLSDNEKPQRIKDCIESWKTVMPDYEIRCWDQNSFDIHSVKWVEQAVAMKKWAFAADYIRLYALYTEGGIYLDSDVRVLKPFDPFLHHRAFSGIEWSQYYFFLREEMPVNNGVNIEAAMLGAEKGHPVIGAFMDYYRDRDFVVDGRCEQTVMPHLLTPVAERFGFNRNDYWSHQVLENDFHIYPYDYFPGQNTPLWDMYVDHNTVAVHLHTGSWRDVHLPAPKRLHHPYTELRTITGQYFRDVWRDSLSRAFKKYSKPKKGGPPGA